LKNQPAENASANKSPTSSPEKNAAVHAILSVFQGLVTLQKLHYVQNVKKSLNLLIIAVVLF
jgi:hypothetical protein